MQDCTIQCRRFNWPAKGNPKDYLRVVEGEYAAQILQSLGIEPTSANKVSLLRHGPLDDCEVRVFWEDNNGSKVVDAIKIVPPARQRGYGQQPRVDRKMLQQWYGGVPERIDVRLPDAKVKETYHAQHHDEGDLVGWTPPSPAGASPKATVDDLAAEFAKLGQGGHDGRQGGARPPVSAAAHDVDIDMRNEQLRHELADLKAKFVLPFACERPRKEGSFYKELVPWPADGPLDVEVPDKHCREAREPINIRLEQIRSSAVKWVNERMPLELLAAPRRDEQTLTTVRTALLQPQVAKLVGLLAHLAYWLILGSCRQEADRLPEHALQSLFSAVQEEWSGFEGRHRGSPLGVSLVLPCLMLTLKCGVERCFEAQYREIMAESQLRQQLIDRINGLFMRLFDPDCVYARFGSFAGSRKALSLSRKLDLMASAQGHSGVKRLHGRSHRATPLVQAMLGAAFAEEGGPSAASDAHTRAMLQRSGRGGAPRADSVPGLPDDGGTWRQSLLSAAMDRLALPADGSIPVKNTANDFLHRRRRIGDASRFSSRSRTTNKDGATPRSGAANQASPLSAR